jgi:NhaA family Na+:H+ antiporter
VYLLFNAGDAYTARGWAIPAATDIAFAMGILLLLGARVPSSLKVFLISLAIFDDIGAIAIIALFYTENISTIPVLIVAASLVVLFMMNRRGVNGIGIYLLVGVVMWVAMLKSGVHATLTGVLLAMFIPLRSKREDDYLPSPLLTLESDLHKMVSYAILPMFAFANAGVDLRGVGLEQLLHPVPVGVALGLFVGKQLGVFGVCWIGVKLGLASLPTGMNWKGLYGVAVLSGVGFTMSLFIGSLAFQETVANRIFDERVGIIAGSLAAGMLGYFVIKSSLNTTTQEDKPLAQT